MTDTELTNANWWASFWSSIESWAFLGVVVALAIEFAAWKFGAPYKEKLEKAKDLKIAEFEQRYNSVT
jgi:predicted cupin superfamily sugar epimerase